MKNFSIFNFQFSICICALTLLASTVTSCKSEVDEVFSQAASERISNAIKVDRQILTSAPNGWVMQYYPDTQYGGYNMLCKFNNDSTVSISTETYKTDTVATSHFSLLQSQGVVLSFDEYNKLFHYFSAPVNQDNIGDAGDGMLGDFEFRVLTASSDSIVMQGKKHGSRIVMTPAPQNADWKDYLDNIINVEDSMLYKYYGLVVDDDTMEVTMSYRTLTFTDPDTQSDVTMPYIVTSDGFKLYQPVSYRGKTIKAFKYSDNGRWEDPQSPTVALLPIIKPLSQQIQDGYWFFTKSGMSAQVKKNFNYALRGSQSLGEDIFCMYLGEDGNGHWGFNFWSGPEDFSTVYIGCFYYNVIEIDDNTIRLNFADDCDDNAYYYYQKLYPNYSYPLMCLGANGGFIYTLTCDNLRNPSWIKLSNVDRPSYTITLTSTTTYYPFEN